MIEDEKLFSIMKKMEDFIVEFLFWVGKLFFRSWKRFVLEQLEDYYGDRDFLEQGIDNGVDYSFSGTTEIFVDKSMEVLDDICIKDDCERDRKLSEVDDGDSKFVDKIDMFAVDESMESFFQFNEDLLCELYG